jgi:hypothetical protein
MQSFTNCKSVYKRIAKWEKLGKKIRFQWSQFKLSYMDFDDRELIYEWVRKKDRRLHIYHIDRKIWEYVLIVVVADNEWKFIDGYWPERKHHEDLLERLRSETPSKTLFEKIKSK